MKYRRGDRPASGIVAALSALRSARSPACGEYPDLVRLGGLARSWGFNLVQLLPVNDSGSQSSPYSARSAFALHPLYIRLADLPEMNKARGAAGSHSADAVRARAGAAAGAGHSAAALPLSAGKGADADAADSARSEAARLSILEDEKKGLAQFAGDERLRYGPFLDWKLGMLRRVWTEIAAERLSGRNGARSAFEKWTAANPWVKVYAVFSELKDQNGGLPWWEWKDWRDASPEQIDKLWAEAAPDSGIRFRAWLQMRAEEQFSEAASELADMGVELMGDLPIMIDKDSAEVWARRSVFHLGLAAGAPPDMYSALGQNWGFPIYDWEAAARDGYSFWKERLASAAKFYSAYRIDHVLGFFRIWTLSEHEETGFLGRFVPDSFICRDELSGLGFDAGRIRWLSQPHIRSADLMAACGNDTDAMEAVKACLQRIGSEELFLFKPEIRGERDIEAAARDQARGSGPGLSEKARAYLLRRWRDRSLYEFEPGKFAPACSYQGSSAWPTLSQDEKDRLEKLFAAKRTEGEAGWEVHGRQLLSILKNSSDMLPCAEDLGSVPGCVPKVLGELGILGLRVLRWTRDWGAPGQPYVELSRYPVLSVACPSVHDSSTLRGWWEKEADRGQVWSFVSRVLGEDLGPAPEKADPLVVSAILRALARSKSRIAVCPIQDILALTGIFSPKNPDSERINVPGSSNDWNWGWRLPAPLEKISADSALAAEAIRLTSLRA